MKELWVPLSGALAQQRNVETIANNVANANTAGFKKDLLTFKEHLTQFEKGYSEDINLPHKEWAPEDFYKSYGAEHGFVKVDGSYTNFEQGQLTPTGAPLDLAINGKGFFEVLTPNGIRYTRRGTFSLGAEGFLRTSDGHLVLSKLEIPESIEGQQAPNVARPEERGINIGQNGKLIINHQGEIFNNGQKVSEISVREFKDIQALKKEGNSFFINDDNKNIAAQTNSLVYQGHVEQSNVNAVQEMTNLIRANRHFESIQKAIKTYDSMAGRSLTELSKF
ncbi:MAG: flagellar basal-body rod protein FlgF [Bacteriovoracaceae bacterium]